jgi:hypothetical protein
MANIAKPAEMDKKPRLIKKAKRSLTTSSRSNSVKNLRSRVSKEYSPTYKLKQMNLENIIGRLQGRKSCGHGSIYKIFKSPVKTMNNQDQDPKVAKPRGRPRKSKAANEF